MTSSVVLADSTLCFSLPVMAEKPLDAGFGTDYSEYSDKARSKLNSAHVDLATSFVEQLYGTSAVEAVDSDFASIGNALDDLLAQAAVGAVESDPMRGKYQDTPIVSVSQSPAISTAHVTPQMTAAVLPPPPGFDFIDEGESVADASSPYMYYDQSCGMSYTSSPSWRPSYPPPFHLGFKLFVGALPYSVTEADLFPLFNQFGEILELHIQRDWLGRSKGCAWLRYSTMDECDAAIEALHNNYYLGSMNRPMQLTYASDSTNSLKGVQSRGRTQSFSSGSILTSAGSSAASSSSEPKSAIPTPSDAPQRPRAMTDLVIPPERETGAGGGGGLLSKLRAISMTAPSATDKEDKLKKVEIFTGIPLTFSEHDIRNLFEQFGPVRTIETGNNSNWIVVFESLRDANRARDTIDGVTLPGCCEAVKTSPVN